MSEVYALSPAAEREFISRALDAAYHSPVAFAALLDTTSLTEWVDGPAGPVLVHRMLNEPVANVLVSEFADRLTDDEFFAAFTHTQKVMPEGTAVSRFLSSKSKLSTERLHMLSQRSAEVVLRLHTFSDVDRMFGRWIHPAASNVLPDFALRISQVKDECLRAASPQPLLDFLAASLASLEAVSDPSAKDFASRSRMVASLWLDDSKHNMRVRYMEDVADELAARTLEADPHAKVARPAPRVKHGPPRGPRL